MRLGKPIVVPFALCLAVVALVGPAHATPLLLDFEDLYPNYSDFISGPYNTAPYHGFQWSRVALGIAYDDTYPAEASYPGAVATMRAAAQDTGQPSREAIYDFHWEVLTVSRNQPWTFNGAQIGTVYAHPGAEVFLQGLGSGSSLLYADTLTPPAASEKYTCDWSGISTLEVWTTSGDAACLDNFRYNESPNGSAVPEPASLCLLGLACGGIGTMLKRRKKA